MWLFCVFFGSPNVNAQYNDSRVKTRKLHSLRKPKKKLNFLQRGCCQKFVQLSCVCKPKFVSTLKFILKYLNHDLKDIFNWYMMGTAEGDKSVKWEQSPLKRLLLKLWPPIIIMARKRKRLCSLTYLYFLPTDHLSVWNLWIW